MRWHPTARRIHANRDGGVYISGVPYRIVLHTTEGSTAEGAIATYRKTGYWPHMTIDPKRRTNIQHFPFDVAGRALANRSGGVETNRVRAIQVELVGRARETHKWSDADVRWLGELLAPIARACDIPAAGPKFVGTEAGTIATSTAPQRMSHQEWMKFSGICGHQHVPENSHWDPGRFKTQILFDAIGGNDEMNKTQENKLDEALERLRNIGPNAQRTVRILERLQPATTKILEVLEDLDAGRVDVEAIAESLRDRLGDEIADELAHRLAGGRR
jgi:hypothetical protein